jgi:restriction system protein
MQRGPHRHANGTIVAKQGEGMARRKRKSGGEDLMDVIALLPWWAGMAIAITSYLFFHALAKRPPPTLTNANQIGAALPGLWLSGVSVALQYVAPLLCLAGAAASFFRRKERETLARSVTSSKSADALDGMSWQEFEMLTGEAFRLQGFDVEEQGGTQADGGVDLVARRGSEIYLVQCKQWRALKVGVDVVRELYGVMAARGAAGGYVVTSGQFTEDARAFAEGRNVRLIDGGKLFGMLQPAKASLAEKGSRRFAREEAAPARVAAVPVTPSCPICSGKMVRRTASKGANAGAQFWGCSTFPKCRGTR